MLATLFSLAWTKVKGVSIADWTLTGIITFLDTEVRRFTSFEVFIPN
jgi:hypothetical protein